MNGSHTTQHIKQECLGDYKGLSEVSAHRGITDGMELKGSGGLHLDHNSLTNSLSSQLFNNEHSPSLGSLSLNSPHHSSRPQASNLKKRCISVLPSSADGIDITTIIRTSQTSLVTCVNGLWTNSAGVSSSPREITLHSAQKPSRPQSCSQSGNHCHIPSPSKQKLNFLKQEPLDEYSSASTLFQHHQELPPPYHLHEQQSHIQGALTHLQASVSPKSLQGKQICRWIDCSAVYDQQDELVRHIEKTHIDQRKGEDFTCFWAGCVRRYKPFNARYKLLIHMRVHSGEKPNKCMVSLECIYLTGNALGCPLPPFLSSKIFFQ
ncbi:Glis3: Zinc finger protein GLIS3 [Crotalus adamanteus]|uniref:Glis3: Zinc finger protein GLIS3 n=1 Tax=Crotalus adamanteus TaxID=8729 RepID=A0AAW1BQH5_CROAD